MPSDWLLSLRDSLKNFPKIEGAVTRIIVDFDERFDQFWLEASRNYPVLFVRDAAYLNWRYRDYPFGKILSFGLFKNDRLLGFSVIHFNTDQDGLYNATLLELFTPGDDQATFACLLGEAIKAARANEANSLSTRLSLSFGEKILVKNGFKRRSMSHSPITFNIKDGRSEDILDNEDNWYTTLGDGDACYFID